VYVDVYTLPTQTNTSHAGRITSTHVHAVALPAPRLHLVVRHGHDDALELPQRAREHLDGLRVQVVGRLRTHTRTYTCWFGRDLEGVPAIV
jgi:hypothetical protein